MVVFCSVLHLLSVEETSHTQTETDDDEHDGRWRITKLLMKIDFPINCLTGNIFYIHLIEVSDKCSLCIMMITLMAIK